MGRLTIPAILWAMATGTLATLPPLNAAPGTRNAEFWVRKLDAPSLEQRLRARREILAIGRPASRFLAPALRDNSWLTRQTCAWLLGQVGDPGTVPALVQILDDRSRPDVDRFFCVGALEKLGGAQARDGLMRALGDPSPSIRYAAAYAVGRVEPVRETAHQLLDMLESRSETEREAAAKALYALTGRDPGYETAEPLGTRQARAEYWRRWWSENGEDRLFRRVPLAEGIRLDGKDCVLYSTVPEDDARPVLRWVEDTYSRYLEWSGLHRNVASPTTIRLFADRREFEEYGSTTLYNFHTYSQFYYSFFFDEIVLYREHDGDINRHWLTHEAFHGFLARHVERVPTWFNEGMAECFEVALSPDGQWSPRAINAEWPQLLREMNRQGRLLPLVELLRLEPSVFYGNDRLVHYAQAWATCHYLLNGRGGRYRYLLRRYLRLLAANKSVEDAIDGTFRRVSVEDLDTEILDYIQDL